jgi:hypothetical protein
MVWSDDPKTKVHGRVEPGRPRCEVGASFRPERPLGDRAHGLRRRPSTSAAVDQIWLRRSPPRARRRRWRPPDRARSASDCEGCVSRDGPAREALCSASSSRARTSRSLARGRHSAVSIMSSNGVPIQDISVIVPEIRGERPSWTTSSTTTKMTQTRATKKPGALRHLAWRLSFEQRSKKTSGAKGIRTPDLLHAMHAGFV